MTLKAGDIIEFTYPFSRDTYTSYDADVDGFGTIEVPTWKVGPKNEAVVGYQGECDSVADALGTCVLRVVSLHKPGKYPERVFFTRTWRDPEGRPFGKGKLLMTTVGAFRTLAGGYRHDFILRGCKCDGCEFRDHRKRGMYETTA